jgi:endonuclease/exonuclease/phosphatase family metal-dependent hydrolase
MALLSSQNNNVANSNEEEEDGDGRAKRTKNIPQDDVDMNTAVEDTKMSPQATGGTKTKRTSVFRENNNDTEVMIPEPTARASSVKQTEAKDENNSLPLTIVSWNISSAQSSAVAPDVALRTIEAPRLIREEILRSQPDIIALQETAYPSFGAEQFGSVGYVSIGSQTALHTDEYVDLLVKKELASDVRQVHLQSLDMNELPVVAAVITLSNNTRITVASLHLPHTKEAAPFRNYLCGSVMDQLVSQSSGGGVILTGDFNMRDFEDKTTEKLCGGQWKDAWKEVTKSSKETKFTWNSRENLYHGPENFKWTCRLDRCYVKSQKVTLKHFALIGNHPVDGRDGDYLSDHFGLLVKCDVAPSDAAPPRQHVDSKLANNAISVASSAVAGYAKASSSDDKNNRAALRAARLQRFENTGSDMKQLSTKSTKANPKEEVEIIDVDAIDWNKTSVTSSLDADRALAERLQQEEAMSWGGAQLGSSAGVDYSNMRPGVLGTLRNKEAYLHADSETRLSKSQNNSYATHISEGVFKDSHPQTKSEGGWVWVTNPQYKNNPKARNDSEDDVARMTTEWASLVKKNLKNRKFKITHRHLIELAMKHNVLHGKWLLNIKPENIQTDWPRIRNALVEGKLGSTAKISDEPQNGTHVVCIYCPDFRDKDELLRVRKAISNDVGMYGNSVLRFKLDAVTYLDLYSRNQWKLKTTSYDCGGNNDEDCSTLISTWEKCTQSEDCKRCFPCCLSRRPKKTEADNNVFSVVGLKYAEATAINGERVTLLRDPENVSAEKDGAFLSNFNTSLLN